MTTDASVQPVLAALRRATADLHARLNKTVQNTQPFASTVAYTTFLSRHRDARCEIVHTHGGLGPPGPWQPRAEAVQLALHHDLQQLGTRHPARAAVSSLRWGSDCSASSKAPSSAARYRHARSVAASDPRHLYRS